MLDDVRAWFTRFIVTMTDADLELLTLWTAHTHLVKEVRTTPRLQFDSPMPGSGKTTALEHLQRLCHRPVLMSSVSSPALLTRLLDAEMRTLLIDEADRTLNPDNDGVKDLLAVLNSGYKSGATRPVLVPVKGGGWEAKEMSTYAPVAIAGNQPILPDDVRSRVLRVLLMPDVAGLAEDSDWEYIEDDAERLRRRLADWADEVRERIPGTDPPLPDRVVGRFREKWRPLARVAAVAGGQWPKVAADLATADRIEYDLDREDGMIRERPAMLLLRHIIEVWRDGESFRRTEDLIADLIIEHPEAWGPESDYGRALTPQRLGRMLVSNYKVHSARDEKARRGYRHADLDRAWRRFARVPTDKPTTPVEPPEPTNAADGVVGSDGVDGLGGEAVADVADVALPMGGGPADDPMDWFGPPRDPQEVAAEALVERRGLTPEVAAQMVADTYRRARKPVPSPSDVVHRIEKRLADAMCEVCGWRLDPMLAATGETTHPACQETAA